MSDTLKIANSIWPNGMKVDSDGHAVFYPLGTNKVKVPTSSAQWPKGNKLVSPFVYDKDDKLVGFVDTKALKSSGNTTIYLPYEHIEAEFSAIDKGKLQIHAPNATTKKASWKDSGVEDIPAAQFKYKGYTTIDQLTKDFSHEYLSDIANGIWSEPLWDIENGAGMFQYNSYTDSYNLIAFKADLPSLTDGHYMFYKSNLSQFSSDLSNLIDGSEMFYDCENLISFSSDLSSLTDGVSMFAYSNLSSFSSVLTSLTDGRVMFDGCDNLTSFTSDLPSLSNGSYMFRECDNLTSFSSVLSSLTKAYYMFYQCENLTSFSSDLSSLTDGSYMFYNCENLTSFSSDLSSLTDGSYMFQSCKLDTPSVQNIADTINTPSSKKKIHIGIGNNTPNAEEEKAFNKMVSKNWTVYVGVNGTWNSSQWNPTSITPIDGEEQQTPIPFWAKPVQSDEETATYTDEQGNYYNILGGNYIYGDDLSTYGMFTCEEDAAANMRLTTYIKPIEN